MTPLTSLVWRRGWLLIGFILMSLIGGWRLAPMVAGANGGIVVTSTADVIADDGVCTLREAVIAANRDLPSGTVAGECAAGGVEDEIIVPSGTYTFTLAGADEDESTTGDLDVVGHVRIVGAEGVVINAAGLDRVFHVSPSGNLTLENLTIEGGIAPHGISGREPTIGEDGGGILSQGTLHLYSSTVRNNSAGNGGSGPASSDVTVHGAQGGRGGGIAHIGAGNLMVWDSTITENRTGDGGNGATSYSGGGWGGMGGNGGGIYIEQIKSVPLQNGVVILSETIISENYARNGGKAGDDIKNGGGGGWGGSGGGLYLQHDAVSLRAIEIAFNHTGIGGSAASIYGPMGISGSGGGIRVAGGSVVIVEETVVSDNINAMGIGSHGGGISSSGLMWLRDSVIEYNQTGTGRSGADEGRQAEPGGNGGGIYQDAGAMVLVRTSIQYNQGGNGGGGDYGVSAGSGGSGGGIYSAGGIIDLQASNVVGNQAGASGEGFGFGGDGGGLFINNILLMTNSTIEKNLSGQGGYDFPFDNFGSGGDGGGILISATGVVTISQSLIAENLADGGFPPRDGRMRSGDGGGIAVVGRLTMANSTISGNRTAEGNREYGASGNGGGIYGDVTSAITLIHTTITENRTGPIHNSSIPGSGGGIFVLRDTIFDMCCLPITTAIPPLPIVLERFLAWGTT